MLKDYNSYMNKINEAEVSEKKDDIDVSNIISNISSKIKDKYKNIKTKATKLSNIKSNDDIVLIEDGKIVEQLVYIVGNYHDKFQTFETKLTSYKDGSYGFELTNKDINISEVDFYRFDGDKLPQDRTKGRYVITDRKNISMIVDKEPKKKETQEIQDGVQTGVQSLQDDSIKSEYTEQDILGLLTDMKNNLNTYDEEKIYNEYLEIMKFIMNSTAINNETRIKLLKYINMKNLIQKYPSLQKIENTKAKYNKSIEDGTFKDIFVDKTAQSDPQGINGIIKLYIDELKAQKDKDGNELTDSITKQDGENILSEIEKSTMDDKRKSSLYKELQELVSKNSGLFSKFPSLKQIGIKADQKNKELT